MRTTVTLDSDTELLLRRLMQEQGLSFKEAINRAIRAGLSPRSPHSFATATFAMGQPAISLDKAVVLAGQIEDDELIRKMRMGS